MNWQGLTQDLAGKKAMIQQAYNFCLLAIIGPVDEKAVCLRLIIENAVYLRDLIFITLVVTAFFSVFLSLDAR